MNVAVLLFDGFDELDAIGPYEVLANAAALGADLRARLVTVAPSERVTGSHGAVLIPEGVLDDRCDLVIVPGGGWNSRADRGLWGEVGRGALTAAIKRLHQSGTTIASVCTGAMALAAAGLLGGRAAVTHAGASGDLEKAGALLVGARVVDDGDIVTAGGVTSGIDLGLWLVERFFGAGLARTIESEMEHRRVGEVFRARPSGD